MLTLKHDLTIIASTLLMLTACSARDDAGPEDRELIGDAAVEHESLEQRLELVPQTARAARLGDAIYAIDGSTSRYVILDTEAGAIDLESIEITDAAGESRVLTELFPDAPPAHMGQLSRDALLLVAAPEEHVEELCERFQFAHDESDLVTVDGEQLLFVGPAVAGRAHALCLLPVTLEEAEEDDRSGAATDLTAEDDPQAYGSGSYTVWVKSLTCQDPRDWENWPYNGDESRLRAFRDGLGGDQIWSSDNVESGDSFSPGRYVHFNNNVKLELYDFDGGLWNANDKLGQEWIYSSEACQGDHYGDFDGSGGGHDWNYNLTYRVYGPACPCQAAAPVYSYSQVETCSVTSQTITNYTYYCSGGTYWQQAWGNTTRHCQTYNKQYNTACELSTFVSQTLLSECDKYQYGVAIGSPVAAGSCPNYPENCPIPLQQTPSFEDELRSNEEAPEVQPLIDPISEPVCPL